MNGSIVYRRTADLLARAYGLKLLDLSPVHEPSPGVRILVSMPVSRWRERIGYRRRFRRAVSKFTDHLRDETPVALLCDVATEPISFHFSFGRGAETALEARKK